ncbi:hypothetical protein JCM3765_002026 [Sporobolomyces pararoseus]
MPNPRAASPPPRASDWTRSEEVSTQPDLSSTPKNEATLAQRRHVDTALSRLLPTSRSEKNSTSKKEEEDNERLSLSSPIASLQPPSPHTPSGLLLFRRRSSTNLVSQEEDRSASSLPLHPLDYPLSRRSSDGTSSAINPSLSGLANRRESNTTSPFDDNTAPSGLSAHYLSAHPTPSTLSRSIPPASRHGGASVLSPIEASPLIPGSMESTPRTSPDSSVEILSSSTFPSPSSSNRSSQTEPFLCSPQIISPRRPSYSVIDLDSRRSSSRASAVPFLPTPSPVSARSLRRQLRRILVAVISLCVLICFIRPSRVELARSFAHLTTFPVIRHFDVDNFLSKPIRAGIEPRNKTYNEEERDETTQEVLQDATSSSVLPIREELRRFREEQLWATSDVKLKTRVVEPRGGAEHEATFIMIHGLSQTVEHSSWLHNELGSRLPSVRWVMPQAPKLPVTYHKQELRPAWFDIKAFPWNGIQDSDEDHYFASTRALNMIIQEERDRLVHAERKRQGKDSTSPVTKEEQQWASKRILIGGFSQGGVMSLLIGLTHENRLGGIIVFSGMLPVRNLLPELVRDLDRNDLPIWWGHGELDPFLLSKDAASSVEVLRNPSPNLALSSVTFQTYPHLQHTWTRKEVEDLSSWMTRSLEGPLKPIVTSPHTLSRSRRRR